MSNRLVIPVKQHLTTLRKYNTVLKYCILKFGAKTKVARKSHVSKDQDDIGQVKQHYRSVRLYFQNESSFGLFTKNGRKLTAKDVKAYMLFSNKVFKNLCEVESFVCEQANLQTKHNLYL